MAGITSVGLMVAVGVVVGSSVGVAVFVFSGVVVGGIEVNVGGISVSVGGGGVARGWLCAHPGIKAENVKMAKIILHRVVTILPPYKLKRVWPLD